MERARILALMQQVARKQGGATTLTEETVLREVGFRSLDFSELALRVEQAVGRELNFDAGRLRGIRTVGDVLDFLQDGVK
jgi:acyl carrier protein